MITIVILIFVGVTLLFVYAIFKALEIVASKEDAISTDEIIPKGAFILGNKKQVDINVLTFLEVELSRSIRSPKAATVLFLEIDSEKSLGLNHTEKKLLKKETELFRGFELLDCTKVRSSDLIFSAAKSDNVFFFLPDTDLSQAKRIVTDLHSHLQKSVLYQLLRIGCAEFPSDGSTLSALFDRARQRSVPLYPKHLTT